MTNALGLMSPYENVVIGNFLYGVGLAVGIKSRGCAPPVCVNLLQQTPLDKPLADVLFQTKGMTRILEFKRSNNKSRKEDYKLSALKVALQPFSALHDISRKVHWYIESMPTPANQTAPIEVCPYLDMRTITYRTTLDAFVNSIAESALSSSSTEPTAEAVHQYVRCISQVGSASASSGGGFVVRIAPDGHVRYAAVHDFRDLLQLDRELLSRDELLHSRLLSEREVNYTPQRTVTQAPDRNLDRGFELER